MKFFIPLLLLFLFTGCSNNLTTIPQQNNDNIKPLWLTKPDYLTHGKRSAVGCAGIHFKGKAEQRKLAISRAIDEIAMQKQTTVSNQTIRESSKGHLQTSKTSSIQSTNNISLSTNVVEEYYDQVNDKLCVLVIEK